MKEMLKQNSGRYRKKTFLRRNACECVRPATRDTGRASVLLCVIACEFPFHVIRPDINNKGECCKSAKKLFIVRGHGAPIGK